jgi:hypothetical protein
MSQKSGKNPKNLDNPEKQFDKPMAVQLLLLNQRKKALKK